MKKNIFLLLFIVMLLAGCEKGGKTKPTVSVSPTATISPTAILTPTPTPTPTKMVLVSDMSFPNHVFHNLEHRLREQYMTMPVPAKHTAFVQEISEVEKQLYEGNIVLWENGTAVDLNGDGYREEIQILVDKNQKPVSGPFGPVIREDFIIGSVTITRNVMIEFYEVTGNVYLACLGGTDSRQVYLLVEYQSVGSADEKSYSVFGYLEENGQAKLFKTGSFPLVLKGKQLSEVFTIKKDRVTESHPLAGESGTVDNSIDYMVIWAESEYREMQQTDSWWEPPTAGEPQPGKFPIRVFFPDGMIPIEPEYKEVTSVTTVYPDTTTKERIYGIRAGELTIYGKSEDGRRVFALIQHKDRLHYDEGDTSYGWFDVADIY